MKYSFLLLLVITTNIFSQINTQVIRGKAVDNVTQSPLIGASVAVIGTNPVMTSITDNNGIFKITNVPLGRYNIQISYIGYNSSVVPEILVTTGKEVVLTIGLEQSVTQLDEVTVKSYSKKDRALNTMAAISARSFTVEETRRYAGGLDDPARMASAFAGVATGNLQDNAIVIRGNAPKGVAWRLEGVDIPNPNHFAGGNVAGGGFVTIFSSQMLSNSDFFTGAFPAEYGNALAGVFDMKLRNGNNEKYEHAAQIGLMGIDISSEGPISKQNGSSYLFNYRYSTTGLLSQMKLIPSEQIPKYQDLSFKFNFPTKNAGVFSVWGIGGIDNNTEPDDLDSTKWETDWDRIKYDWNVKMGATGVTHKYMIGTNTYINSTIAASGTNQLMDATRIDDNLVRRPNWYFIDKSGKVTLSSYVNHKFNAKNTLRAGANMHFLFFNLNLNSTVDDDPATFANFVKQKGNSQILELYTQDKYSITDKLTFNAGIHYNYFAYNGNFSIEPRGSIKWQFKPKQALSFGYGIHSQMEELKMYAINYQVNGSTYYPNKKLGFSYAEHFVLGYDLSLSENTRLKVEPYLQYLYNVPGKPNSSYSMINFTQDWSFRDSLLNNSKGQNYGVELTLERFLNNNFYYLATVSVFKSKYKASDGIWRNTRFDKGLVFNILAGKEFFLKKDKVLGLNMRFNYLGGDRYEPVLVDESIAKKKVIYDDSNVFRDQYPASCYLDITITYRINRAKYSGIWALQLKNALGAPLREGYSYNYKTNKIEESNSIVMLPVISYKIEF
jgi:hypothetical protein